MKEVGTILCLALVAVIAYTLGEWMDARRRRLRAAFLDRQPRAPLGEFALRLSALSPVPTAFAREFRRAVAQALGCDAELLDPRQRIRRDLRIVNFDAVELAGVLEHALDIRVRVRDIYAAKTLRDLCLRLHERSLAPSDFDPPLHRDPVAKQPPPAADPPPGEATHEPVPS